MIASEHAKYRVLVGVECFEELFKHRFGVLLGLNFAGLAHGGTVEDHDLARLELATLVEVNQVEQRLGNMLTDFHLVLAAVGRPVAKILDDVHERLPVEVASLSNLRLQRVQRLEEVLERNELAESDARVLLSELRSDLLDLGTVLGRIGAL